jgi:transcriptional regulator with XRE-family HTH domain
VQVANSLTRIRNAFGWSQDAMAVTLGVNVRTITKWEAVEPPDLNPFLKFIWASTTRYSDRLYRYGCALLPECYLNDVRRSPYERSLFIGPEAVVLAMSEETKRMWGTFRYAEGMSVAAFSGKNEAMMLAENYEAMGEIITTGDFTRVVNFLTKEAPLGSTPPLWRSHFMHAPFPEVFDMLSIPISEEEYAAATHRFRIISGTEYLDNLVPGHSGSYDINVQPSSIIRTG